MIRNNKRANMDGRVVKLPSMTPKHDSLVLKKDDNHHFAHVVRVSSTNNSLNDSFTSQIRK